MKARPRPQDVALVGHHHHRYTEMQSNGRRQWQVQSPGGPLSPCHRGRKGERRAVAGLVQAHGMTAQGCSVSNKVN